jgi:3'(2'), 5'-bisphosphate nucleotidase
LFELSRPGRRAHRLPACDVPAPEAKALLPASALAAEPPPLPELDSGPIRITVSRSRAPELARKVAERVDGELVPGGSAGAKVAAVLLGDVDAYVHAGGQYEWDSAAPVAVAHAFGAHASRIDGSPLVYNQEQISLPDIVVCHPELAPTLLAGIRAVL